MLAILRTLAPSSVFLASTNNLVYGCMRQDMLVHLCLRIFGCATIVEYRLDNRACFSWGSQNSQGVIASCGKARIALQQHARRKIFHVCVPTLATSFLACARLVSCTNLASLASSLSVTTTAVTTRITTAIRLKFVRLESFWLSQAEYPQRETVGCARSLSLVHWSTDVIAKLVSSNCFSWSASQLDMPVYMAKVGANQRHVADLRLILNANR